MKSSRLITSGGIVAFVFMVFASLVGAQTLQTLCSFNGARGANPQAALTLGVDGNFYGTTAYGGIFNSTNKGIGTVFKMTTNGTLTTLVSFNGTNGAVPVAALTLGIDGNFYGTTEGGGSGYGTVFNFYGTAAYGGSGYGTVFKVTTNGTLTTLVYFNGSNGANPMAALTLGNDGNFYGTTYGGGGNGQGTVFKVTTNGSLTTLVTFKGTNGANPKAALTLGPDGNFYGTTYSIGNGYGTIFQVTTNGTLTTLVSFNNGNGARPRAGLTLGIDGNFYGTTSGGGHGYGTVFQVTTNGMLTTLVSFLGNGGYPFASLTLGIDGNFYGTTEGGYGTVFKVTTNGTLTTLVYFNNTNGANPYAALTLGLDGNFYGTTYYGGITNYTFPSGMGTVFKVTTNGTLTKLASFSGNGTIYNDNGANPQAGLTLGIDGNFYGTTHGGGGNGQGTVFKVTTNGSLTTLVTFNGTNGANPMAALTLGLDGNFYGTTYYGGGSYGTTYYGGGGNGQGTVFKVTTNGSLTTLVSFNGYDAANPMAALTLGNDGNFHGTTEWGGLGNYGTVFTMTTNGSWGTVSFNGDEANPMAALTLGNDGNFYGTTDNGGYVYGSSGYNNGTVFKVTTYGTLTKLATLFIGNNGAYPSAALTLGNDGNFYGTTIGGGSGYGTVFKMTTDGYSARLTTLVFFNNGNGANPMAALTLGNDGNFYGTTAYGGNFSSASSPYGMGTIFKVTTNGTLTMLVTFNGGNGAYPFAALTLGNDGNFYGTTEGGGSSDTGTVFRLLLPPAITVQPKSQTNNAGATVTFLCNATSLKAIGYQWQKNGTNLVDGDNVFGATTNTLTISGISDSDAARYSVIVSNADFNLTSSNTMLTVIYPPVITAQPLGQRLVLGNGVAFNVAVSGTAPFNYQWRFNAGNLLNATNALYAIPAVGTNHTGNYSVVVTNFAGSVTSSNALLVVLVPPSLALQWWAGYPLLNLNGMLSNNFTVQYSPDLTGTNWITLQTFSNLLTSQYLFLDPDGAGEPARFYRAVMQ